MEVCSTQEPKVRVRRLMPFIDGVRSRLFWVTMEAREHDSKNMTKNTPSLIVASVAD
jgi:hypothetical protein